MKFLLNMLTPEPIETFGLDIGSHTVKAVKIKTGSDGKLTATNVGLKKINNPDNSDANSPKSIVYAIEECVNSASISSEYAVCAVSGPEVAVRPFQFPKMPLEEISQAVVLEAEQVCPFDIKNSIVDYNLIDSAQGRINGILVAATADTITRISSLVKKADLRPVLMDAEALAIINCFNYCVHDKPETYGILNIGGSDASLIIDSSDKVPFVRPLQCTGEDIIKWFCDNKDISKKQAYEQVFDENEIQDQAQLQSDMTNACSNIVTNIAETLRFYASDRNRNVEKIYLCGGFSCSKSIVDILQRNLLCDIQLWNPFDAIECERGVSREQVEKYGPSLVVAAGLAMRKV